MVYQKYLYDQSILIWSYLWKIPKCLSRNFINENHVSGGPPVLIWCYLWKIPKSKLASTECGKMPPNKRNVTTTLPSPETDREVYVESLCLQVADHGRTIKFFLTISQTFEQNGQINWINHLFIRPRHFLGWEGSKICKICQIFQRIVVKKTGYEGG